MTEESTPCSVCGGSLHRREIMFTQVIDDRVYIVKGVPALVCSQCGEQYLEPDTVDAIQAGINRGDASESLSVPVYYFGEIAA